MGYPSRQVDYPSRAVFIDRDGVVLKPVLRMDFQILIPTAPLCMKEFQIFPWVAEALALLKEMGFLRILITNQPDVKKGNISQKEWRAMQNRVEALDFDDVFICPHLTEDNCECKKPRPGMLLAAARKWDLVLSRCYMVGDLWTDTGAARYARCISILVRAWYNVAVKSDYVANNLLDAVHLIQKLERGRR